MASPIGVIHTWADGDTWWELAARYTGTGLNWVLIAEANLHLGNPADIPVGSRVLIPREVIE